MWLLIISHPSFKFASNHEFITFFICHVTLCDKVHIKIHHSVKFSSHRSRESWDITFFISHVITWSHDQSVKILNEWWINEWWHNPRGSGDILFFISHVTSYGDVITGSSLPCGVAISLVEIEISSILIFGLRIRIHMIIWLQSVTIQFSRLFWHISYYKVR